MNKETISAFYKKQDYGGLVEYLEKHADSMEWFYQFIRASEAYSHANRDDREIYEKYAKISQLGSEILIAIQPTGAEYLALRGLVLHHDGDYEEALRFYTKALESEPENLSYQNDVANALKALERFSDAEKMYIKLLDTNLRVGVLHNLTMLHLFQGNLGDAQHYAREYQKENSENKIGSVNRQIERVLQVKEFNDETLDYVFEHS